jgi:TonB family protein
MRVGAQLVLTFLLNASWQIALIAAFATACDWLLRGTSARYRHGLWVAALGMALVLPMLTSARLIKTRLSATPQPIETAPAPVFVTTTYSPELDSAEPRAIEKRAEPLAVEPARRNFLTEGIHLNRRLGVVLIVLYALFLLCRAGQLVRAWRRTKTIVQSAYDCDFSAQVKPIIEKCQTAIGEQQVRILCSTSVLVPITVGILQPLIILPEALVRDVDQEVLTSAVGHELVHVARRDYLANLIYEIIYLPLSFHPAATLIRRRIKQTRELCCDESVTTKLLKAETYVRSLVRLIGAAPLEHRPAVDTTIGISDSDILEVRIMSLLKTKKLTTRRKTLMLIMATLLLVAPCVAAASFALALDLDRQEPAATVSAEKTDRQKQKREREELKRTERELREKAQSAPASQRAEAEARLLEVQRNLELHERLLREFDTQREQKEKSIQELRESLAQLEKNRPDNEARMKEIQKQIAEMETLYTPEIERAVRQNIAQMQTLQSDRKARVIYRVEPEYPPDAREKKIEGTVVLTLTVDHEGLPQNIQVKKSLYPSLDQSAVEAARKMRFEPAIKNGQPVSMWISVEMEFRVEPGQYDPQRAIEDRLKREAYERERAGGGGDLETKRRRELQEIEERARRQADLVRGATLSMDRAIQIATSQVPGKVITCTLGREGDKLFYHVVIISEGEKNIATDVWVSAIDGQILKTEKEERREESASERVQGAPISAGVLNGKAVSLPPPVFPAIAKAAHASGSVTVEITIDETGNVIAAHAVSGHPLLQSAAVDAARQASFKPTRLSGEPVKVFGVLVYNFVTQ